MEGETPKKPRKKVVKKRPELVIYKVTPKQYDRAAGEEVELPPFEVKVRWEQEQRRKGADGISGVESTLIAKYGYKNVSKEEI
jgi:hypothetical protein